MNHHELQHENGHSVLFQYTPHMCLCVSHVVCFAWQEHNTMEFVSLTVGTWVLYKQVIEEGLIISAHRLLSCVSLDSGIEDLLVSNDNSHLPFNLVPLLLASSASSFPLCYPSSFTSSFSSSRRQVTDLPVPSRTPTLSYPPFPPDSPSSSDTGLRDILKRFVNITGITLSLVVLVFPRKSLLYEEELQNFYYLSSSFTGLWYLLLLVSTVHFDDTLAWTLLSSLKTLRLRDVHVSWFKPLVRYNDNTRHVVMNFRSRLINFYI